MKFSSIAWTRLGEGTEQNPLGFCIGGHPDGSITLWNITTLLNGASQKQKANYSCIFNQKLLKSQINVLTSNVKPHLFAAGSQQISILSIEKNMTVSVAVQCLPPDEGGDFCSLNFNERVNHILASSTTTGYTYIYDMKKQELYLTIFDQSLINEEEQAREGPVNTSVLWYNDGAQIVIAYDDPEYNYLTQYHMKQPKAPSAMYQNGHTTSIIDMVKNSHDNNFLLSLGRDNLVTCWSMRTQKPLVRIQLKEKCSQVAWINKITDCFICVGYDGKLYYDRINFSEDYTLFTDNQEMLPKWMNKPCGISFAFGGKLYEFNQAKETIITVYKPNRNKAFVDLIKNFITKIEASDLSEALDEKINSSDNKSNVSLFWNALKSMYTKNLDGLFRQMGFDRNQYNKDVNVALGKKTKESKKDREICLAKFEETDEDVSKLFEKSSNIPKEVAVKSDKQDIIQFEKPNTIQESISRNINWNVGHEKLIKQSLQFGELESAVELLFKNNRSSEALIIASHHPELFKKATEIYFNNNKDLFVKSIFPAIINNNFDVLFDYNVVKEWKEYLLYSKTYLGNSNDFVSFADRLGDKLSTNPDIYSSLVCYVLAEKYNKCIDLLINNYQKEIERYGRDDKNQALHNLFEQVIALTKILNEDLMIKNENYNSIIYDYCQLLIEEGLIMEASKYLINIRDNSNLKIVELYDRLYYHCEHELGKKFSKPVNPYNVLVVKQKAVTAKAGRREQGKGIVPNPNLFDNPSSTMPQKNFKPVNSIYNPTKTVNNPLMRNIPGKPQETPFNQTPSQSNPPMSSPGISQFEQKKEQDSMPKMPFTKTVKPPMVKPPFNQIPSQHPQVTNPPINPPYNQPPSNKMRAPKGKIIIMNPI